MVALTLIAAYCVTSSTVRDPLVTFEARASRIENILPELSRVTGTQLTFSPQTRDEVLLIKVKDLPLRTLMNQIARSAKAEWKQESDGWRLIRTPVLLAELEEQHTARIEKRFQKSIDGLRARLEKFGKLDNARAAVIAEQVKTAVSNASAKLGLDSSDYRFAEAIDLSLPGPKLAAQIALTIPAATYASLPLGMPVVYALKANRMQRPLVKDVRPYLREFSSSAKLLRSYLPNGVPYGTGLPPNIYQVARMLQEPEVGADRIHFVVTRYAPGGSARIQLKVANESGKIVDQSELSLFDLFGEVAKDPLPLGHQADEAITLSDVSRKWIETARRMSKGQPADPASEFRGFLSDSLRQEPAQHLYSELMFGLANLSGRNIVASTSVGKGDFSTFGIADLPPTPDRFVRFLQSGYPELTIRAEGDFIGIEPTDWVEQQMYRIDSRARGKFRRKALSRIDIEDIVTLAADVNAVQGFGTELRFVRSLSPASGVPDSYQFELLRILGLMTVEQRMSAKSEEGLRWIGLTLQQQNLFFQLIADERMKMNIDERGAFDANSGHVWKRESLDFQPSELYGNGIPDGTVLRIMPVASPSPRLEFQISTFPKVTHQTILVLPS